MNQYWGNSNGDFMKTAMKFLLLITFILLVSCTDNAKHERDIANYRLVVEKAISQDTFENIHNPLLFNDLIVFLDPVVDIIYCYDLTGKQVFTIDNSEGNGEYRPVCMFVDHVRNSLAVVNGYKNEILYFNESGNLEDTFSSAFGNLVFSRHSIENRELINYAKPVILEEESIIENKVSFVDRGFNNEDVISSSSYSALNNYNLTGSLISEVCSDGVYIVERSIDEYKILKYNFKGELERTIKKKYSRVRRTEEEIKNAVKHVRYISNILQTVSSNEINGEYMYFNAIESIGVRHDTDLWVRTQDEDGRFFDMYHCNGNAVGHCRIGVDFYEKIMFSNNDIYGFKKNENGKYEICKLRLTDI